MTEAEKAARVRKYYKRDYYSSHIRWLLQDESGNHVSCDKCGNIANVIHIEYLDGLRLHVAICKEHAQEMLNQNPDLTIKDLYLLNSKEVKEYEKKEAA